MSLVGKAGLEPAMFLMSRFYRPLASAVCILTQVKLVADGRIRTDDKRDMSPLLCQAELHRI